MISWSFGRWQTCLKQLLHWETWTNGAAGSFGEVADLQYDKWISRGSETRRRRRTDEPGESWFGQRRSFFVRLKLEAWVQRALNEICLPSPSRPLLERSSRASPKCEICHRCWNSRYGDPQVCACFLSISANNFRYPFNCKDRSRYGWEKARLFASPQCWWLIFVVLL